MAKRVLCLLADGFEEIETITPIDLLRRADVEVVVAGLHDFSVKGRCGITLLADALLSDVVSEHFDLLFIPGGPGVGELRNDGRAADLAKLYLAGHQTVAAICAAPLVLLDAGLLTGRKFTAHDSVHADLPGVVDERVVVDGNLITSRGAGTALDFAFALVERLAGQQAAADVSKAIMA